MTQTVRPDAAALSEVLRRRIIPVVIVHDPSDAGPLSEALCSGGLPVAEVTFRTVAALESIAAMAQNPNMLVGAGTIIHPDQVDAAAEAGARFLVSPGFSRAVIRRAYEIGLPIIPGIVTATELMAAINEGIRVVKFFPAGTSGGLQAIKALAGPFPQIEFVPTGGVGVANLGEYLSAPAVAAVGGSWMVAPSLVAAGDFASISRLTREALEAVPDRPKI
jgi:2-dehydro-3-deoxyphosphogluconate aldolase/(4S)-4-hydroxy-2-oxoglutarate aldolase